MVEAWYCDPDICREAQEFEPACPTSILILVVHGGWLTVLSNPKMSQQYLTKWCQGSVLDGDTELAVRKSDVTTFRSSFELPSSSSSSSSSSLSSNSSWFMIISIMSMQRLAVTSIILIVITTIIILAALQSGSQWVNLIIFRGAFESVIRQVRSMLDTIDQNLSYYINIVGGRSRWWKWSWWW